MERVGKLSVTLNMLQSIRMQQNHISTSITANVSDGYPSYDMKDSFRYEIFSLKMDSKQSQDVEEKDCFQCDEISMKVY